MARSIPIDSALAATPAGFLKEAVRQVPALKYAIGVGGVAAVVAVVLTGWKLEPQTAVLGGLCVFVAMVVLVLFSALSRTGPRVLRPLALFLAWTFLAITVAVAFLFVSCAFFDRPKRLPCLFRDCDDTGTPFESGTKPEIRTVDDAVSQAKSVLTMLYARQLEDVYNRMAPSVQTAFPFANYRRIALKMMVQVNSGPLRRKLELKQEQSGVLYILFDAEFDETSTWYEALTYVKTPQGWKLNSINFQPISWKSAAGNARPLTETTPAQVLAKIRAGEATPGSFSGGWIPPSGWRANFTSILAKRGERTCDVELASGGASLLARNVLGGCALTVGTEIDVLGKVVSVDGPKIEIEEVRFTPT